MPYKIFIFSLIIFFNSFSQDTITFTNGEKSIVKIIEMETKFFKYKMVDYLDGPLIIVDKNEIICINYENGFVEKFNILDNNELKKTELQFLGTRDAKLHFNGDQKSIPIPIISSILFTPIIGFFHTKYLANKKIGEEERPKGYTSYENFNGPSKYAYYNNPIYIKSFVKAAKKKQKKRIWRSYLFGSIVGTPFWAVFFVSRGFDLLW